MADAEIRADAVDVVTTLQMPGGYLFYYALQVLLVNLELVGDSLALSVCEKIHVALEYELLVLACRLKNCGGLVRPAVTFVINDGGRYAAFLFSMYFAPVMSTWSSRNLTLHWRTDQHRWFLRL